MRELSLHILDIAENSIGAGASEVTIKVTADTHDRRLEIGVTDNGRGMSEEMASRATDPFVTTRTTRRVGLGLPLLQAAAERSAGAVTLESEEGHGTQVRATFGLDHIDRAPLGNILDTVTQLVAANPEIRFRYEHRVDDREFVFDASEVARELDGVPIDNPLVIEWIHQYLEEGIRLVGAID